MKPTTKQVLTILNVLSWLIFIGLCVLSGTILFNIIYTLAINPVDAKYFQPGLDLSGLYAHGTRFFLAETLGMTLVAAMKAYIFYVIILIFQALNLVQPFSRKVGRLIFRMSYVSLLIGVLSGLGIRYNIWLIQRGIWMPDIARYFGGFDVFLMMGAALYVIAQIFQRGIEIQSENELTV